MSYQYHVSVATNATTSEGYSIVDTKKTNLLVNDSTSTITFNFDGGTTESNYFTLKTGEALNDMKFPVYKIYYTTASTSAAFRFLGEKQDYR